MDHSFASFCIKMDFLFLVVGYVVGSSGTLLARRDSYQLSPSATIEARTASS